MSDSTLRTGDPPTRISAAAEGRCSDRPRDSAPGLQTKAGISRQLEALPDSAPKTGRSDCRRFPLIIGKKASHFANQVFESADEMRAKVGEGLVGLHQGLRLDLFALHPAMGDADRRNAIRTSSIACSGRCRATCLYWFDTLLAAGLLVRPCSTLPDGKAERKVSNAEIAELQYEMCDQTLTLHELLKDAELTEVPNCSFQTVDSEVTLLGLFGDKRHLLAIHNMGQACRHCTLWGDGLNGVLPHLEDAMSVVMLSKDPVAVRRNFASPRNWRFGWASHGGGDYIKEQTVMPGEGNMPGAVMHERAGDQVLRRSTAIFGPGDLCSPA